MCEACIGASYAGVVYREARDGNGSPRIGYRAYWKDGNDNPALRNFIRLLEERCPPVGNGNGSRGGTAQLEKFQRERTCSGWGPLGSVVAECGTA
jgi:hypothetical protein